MLKSRFGRIILNLVALMLPMTLDRALATGLDRLCFKNGMVHGLLNLDQNSLYKYTTSRQRQKALWSEARCAAALGRYDDAKRLLRNAIAYDEDTIFKLTPTLDLALICLLNNEHEEAREMVIDMITTIKSNPRRATGMTNLGIVEREIRLLNALGEQDKADDLIETLSEYFLKDRFFQKVRPARVSELNKLRTRLNSALSAHEKLPAQKLKKLSIEKPITRCFLTFYECDGRE